MVSAAAGFLLGFPVLRLRGDYPAIVTLGFGEIVRILLLNNTEITGGPNGISQIPKPTFFGLEFSRSAREGGWDTFSNFFGVKYDPSDRVIFLYGGVAAGSAQPVRHQPPAANAAGPGVGSAA